jgi:hypothetical protein
MPKEIRIVQCGIVIRERGFDGKWRITYGNGWPAFRVSLFSGWREFVRTLRRLLSIRIRVVEMCDTCFGDGWIQPERDRVPCPQCGLDPHAVREVKP